MFSSVPIRPPPKGGGLFPFIRWPASRHVHTLSRPVMAVDDSQRARILAEFSRIQDDFLEIGAYIPPVPDFTDARYSIASPRIGEFGLDCCTWVETLMRELLADPRSNDIPGIEVVRTGRDVNVDDFRRLLGPKYGFARGGYRLKEFEGPELRPFEEWERDQNPEWFRTYSRFKHDRFELAQRFTFGHAIRALAALEMLAGHWPGHDPGVPTKPEQPRSRVFFGRRL